MIDQSSKSTSTLHPSAPAEELVNELLMGMRLYGLHYKRIQAAPPFGIRFGDDSDKAQFHFVAQGPVYLQNGVDDVRLLVSGDAVLLPRGTMHALLSEPDLPCRHITRFDATVICEVLSDIEVCCKDAATKDKVVVFSGCMDFDMGTMHALVDAMPEVMQADTLLDSNPEILPILEAMERETHTKRAGFVGILTRLADVVSASLVRSWVERGCSGASGWVEALRDSRLGRVIAAVHRDPGHRWTVENMAAQMGNSRSLFAKRFQSVTGTTPLRYVTELRMRLATRWMTQEQLSIETVAERLGYNSQAAFSRAYKRVTGHPPGAARRTQVVQ